MNVISISPETAATNISHMGGAGKIPDQDTVFKRWCDDGDVMFMACAFPWIIGDVDITFGHILSANTADKMAHRISHCIDMTRGAGHRLSEHFANVIINAGRKVTCFADRG